MWTLTVIQTASYLRTTRTAERTDEGTLWTKPRVENLAVAAHAEPRRVAWDVCGLRSLPRNASLQVQVCLALTCDAGAAKRALAKLRSALSHACQALRSETACAGKPGKVGAGFLTEKRRKGKRFFFRKIQEALAE